ncbi:MAG: hypothetical protein OEZ68_21295 [Gammaproteobacteria bacterium]|nr:hypothetical protein [Gammaproteobacteria bacterium]MDH5803338.1 hypothetical protein [Gammaproteobacteria bacterium]
MELEIETQYTQQLIREGARMYWKNTFAGTFLLCLTGILVSSVLIFFMNINTWITMAFLAVACLGCLIFGAIYFMFKQRSLTTFKQMEFPVAKWKFTEQDVAVESYLGKSRFKWEMLREVIKSDTAWLLVYQNSAYSLFPIIGIPGDTLAMIENKVSETGGKIA